MLLCPAIRMIVNAPTPDSPSLVSIVWRREWRTKSAGNLSTRFPSIFGAHTRVQQRGRLLGILALGQQLVCICNDNPYVLTVVNVWSGREISYRLNAVTWILKIAVMSDGNTLIMTGGDGIRVCSLSTGEIVTINPVGNGETIATVDSAHVLVSLKAESVLLHVPSGTIIWRLLCVAEDPERWSLFDYPQRLAIAQAQNVGIFDLRMATGSLRSQLKRGSSSAKSPPTAERLSVSMQMEGSTSSKSNTLRPNGTEHAWSSF